MKSLCTDEYNDGSGSWDLKWLSLYDLLMDWIDLRIDTCFFLWALWSGSFWSSEELHNFRSKFVDLYIGWSQEKHVYTWVKFLKFTYISKGFLFINYWSTWSVMLYLCCLSMMPSCWYGLTVWSRTHWIIKLNLVTC